MRSPRLMLFTATFAAVSCTSRDSGAGAARVDSGSGDSTVTVPTVWFDSVLPFLLAPAHSNDRALIVPADSMAADPADGSLPEPGTLLSLDGSTLAVRVSVSSGSDGCIDAVLQPAPSGSWGVGFVGRAPSPLRVDSVRAISRQDSAALAPVIFRLASAVPDSTGGRFTGLPFSLGDLWRMRAADGSTIVVATTRRQINQEDSPLEERTLLIAETDPAGSYALAYSSRSAGREETVEGRQLLAAVIFPGHTALELVFAHDYGNENAYGIIERTARGKWRLRWTSRRFSC